MWLYFNQNGRLLEVSEYDGQARAGTTAFKIFAVFENIDIDTEYTQATLKLYKPDDNGGSYPLILMEKGEARYEGPTGVHLLSGQRYNCYSFDFSDLQSGGVPVVLLDIPGLWYAVITLRDARRINVVGSSSFNVQDGISSETDEMEAFDAILDYFYRNFGEFVPYSGATRALDLGEQLLIFKDGTTEEQGDISITDGDNLEISTSNGDIWLNPAGVAKYNGYEIATKNDLSSYVPYTGADHNLNLGEYDLLFEDSSNKSASFDFSGGDLYISTSDGDIILSPDGIVQYGGYEIATKHDIPDVSNCVPYTGATNDVDLGNYALKAGGINLQKDNSQGASIKVKAGENSQGSAYGQLYVTNDYYPEGLLKLADTMGTATTYSPTSIKVLGNQYKISFPEVQKDEVFALESETKLYKHMITVANYGQSDYAVLTIISKTETIVADVSSLGNIIIGFVYGSYVTDTNLVFTLVECSVFLNTFELVYIDENHAIVPDSWSNAVISGDVVEEI